MLAQAGPVRTAARRALVGVAVVLGAGVFGATALAAHLSLAPQPVLLETVAPVVSVAPVVAATSILDPLQDWAQQQSELTGIPVPAMRAYGRVELRLAREQPRCRVGWVTLAGIGKIESDHGRYDGRALGEDGRSSTPIIGIALDGVGVAHIVDSDGGVLDGDAALDRAVGPMQVLPSTWRRWGADGDADGRVDVQDLDDAALAAGRYLCASGSVASDSGWRAAVLSYNASTQYLLDVAAWAGAYATASSGRG